MAQDLENAAKAGDLEAVEASNATFIAAAENLIRNLRTVLDRFFPPDTKDGKPTRQTPDAKLLERLRGQASRYDTSGMEETLSELEAFSYEIGGELVSWLREKAEELEYDEITRRLENLTV
jgi:hypothetical protein